MFQNATRGMQGEQRQVQWVSGLNVLVGLWLIAAPFVLAYSNIQAATWSDIIVGAVVAVIAAIRAGWAPAQAGLSVINVVLGAWVVASPWILGFSGTQAALWANVLTGVAIVVIAALSALGTTRYTGSGPGGTVATR